MHLTSAEILYLVKLLNMTMTAVMTNYDHDRFGYNVYFDGKCNVCKLLTLYPILLPWSRPELPSSRYRTFVSFQLN